MRAVLVVMVCVGGACARQELKPVTPQPPPPVRVPAGCQQSQAGEWVHADDPSWRYHAEDDGGTLTMVVSRVELPPDAGFRPRLFRDGGVANTPSLRDAGPPVDDAGQPNAFIHLTLERTPYGFVGHTTATVPHPTGRTCEVRFKTELLSCADGGLVLQAETATALGDTCQAPAKAQPVPMAEHRLKRPPPLDR